MKQGIMKYLFLLMAMAGFAACSSDDKEGTFAAPTLSETEVNVEFSETFYSLTVSSRTVWSATVESGSDWLKLVSAKGVGGTAEKLSFEMTKNTTKTPRVANIKVSCGTASTYLKVTQGPTTIEFMNESDVPDFKKYYKPREFNFDMLRNDSKWSFFRYKQSEHFFVFWDAYFGSDPNSTDLAEGDRVDVDNLLQKAEQFYKTNINKLGMVVTGQGKSYLDDYKMEIYLLDPTPEWWVATGAGYDNVIGALWVTPSTCKPVGSVIGHEIGHSFQYQTYCDNVKNGAANDFKSGFRYGYEGSNGGCGFWEQCAQWQSYQDYPQQALNDNWNSVWYQQCHRHFEHEWQRYASYYLHYYWSQLHGDKTLGRIWNESKYPEDATQAYMRIFLGNNYDKAKKELFEYAQRCVTFDFDGTRAYFTTQNELYKTSLYSQDGYHQISYKQCPQPMGFNVIKLDVPASGTKVTVQMEALKTGSILAHDDPGNMVDGDFKVVGTTTHYNAVGSDQAVAYGFVALKQDGTRNYSEMNLTDATGEATYSVPAGTQYLYLVVQGAPKSYHQCPWDEKEQTDMQCPYRFKISGTDLFGNFSIDESKAPTNVEFSYDLKCDVAADYVQGTIQLAGNDLKKLAQAFVMQPSVLSSATLPIATGTEQKPTEGKIALGLLQPNGSIAYNYTANVGFYCKADGSVGAWGDTDPVWFEYDKDTFVITYGHKPGNTKAGDKVTIKPVLVYTKDGKQYKATFILNMQF